MTYEVPLVSTIKAKQLKTVTKKNGELFHTIRFNYIHLGDPAEATIQVEQESQNFMLRSGLNEVDFLIRKVGEPTSVKTVFTVGDKIQKQDVQLKPVKEWTVYLVQHSHTDIGYTRAQSEILAEHLRYIDYALDYCDQTDSYSEDAQFRWTCEASWAVREYLNNRPKEQTDRLIQRIKEGRIEVTGMFFNFSEVVDETALAIQLQALKQFREQGIDVTSAMQNDVNGIGWCMVDYYHNTGVKYLTMGQHGHRA
ncbi:MAG: glycosyl hydrolase family 38, partial [Marinilabiliales bacterium]